MDKNNNKNNSEKTPHEILGVNKDADFEEIKKARDIKVKEAGDDLIAKAKIEATYDQLLMGSLQARKSGSMSFDAQNASLKEKQVNSNKTSNSKFPLLSKIANLNNNQSKNTQNFTIPNIQINNNQLSTRLSIGLLFFILLFISPDPYNRLLLSLSTLIFTYVQIKSGRRFLSALGWSVTFLSIGLIFGGLIETNSFFQEVSGNSVSVQKLQSFPAILILWIGIVIL